MDATMFQDESSIATCKMYLLLMTYHLELAGTA